MDGGGQHILIIDDDAGLRALLVEILSGAGFRVSAVESGAGALSLLKAGAIPSLIVLDLMMPEMDGWTFLRMLRGYKRLASIPVVVLTGAIADRELLSRPEAPPLVGVLEKPVPPATILRLAQTFCASAP
jgi:CheY-like chemotaxis protein